MACPIPRGTRILLAYRKYLLHRLAIIRDRLDDNREMVIGRHRADGWHEELHRFNAELRAEGTRVGTASGEAASRPNTEIVTAN